MPPPLLCPRDIDDRIAPIPGRERPVTGAWPCDRTANPNLIGGGDAVRFVFGDETANGRREREVILDYEAGLDEIDLGGASIRKVREFGNNLQIELDGDRDMIFLTGVGDIDEVTFLNAEGLAFV
ncbi:hypothetical protein CLV79_10523 [Limimaricola soesokkakensis]|uniref:Uncharacterized protein n=1 Tax=Limimaricola soesokkakensis TaxID=1343159 RepID=A0A1X6ZDV5_9RHOB|nr:hypothetical protein CLV79_10523 [Limimaricola soesokkakensis]SLN48199.1 hypothetical protein LOS8367_02149 [Limimaricola soesokkakensis]